VQPSGLTLGFALRLVRLYFCCGNSRGFIAQDEHRSSYLARPAAVYNCAGLRAICSATVSYFTFIYFFAYLLTISVRPTISKSTGPTFCR